MEQLSFDSIYASLIDQGMDPLEAKDKTHEAIYETEVWSDSLYLPAAPDSAWSE